MNDLPVGSDPSHTTAASISKAEINTLPLGFYEGPIALVRTRAELETALTRLQGESLLGFDTETRPSFHRGESYLPSLVQLATESHVVIVQLEALGADVVLLREIFSHAGVKKAGIAPRDDLKKLKDLISFEAEGFHDLSDLARRAGYRQTGLRALAAMVLGVRVSKAEQVSNWARRDLTSSQLRYAATDAWMTRRIFQRLSETGNESHSVRESV